MPRVRRSRTIAAPQPELWRLIGDPHHLPRWWPRVSRVEAVEQDAFTEVLVGAKGKTVRADFRLLDSEPGRRVVWAQQVLGTPFERILKSAETEIELLEAPAPALDGSRPDGQASATEVRIELRQTLRGFLTRLGSRFVRRAAAATVDEALDGLERLFA